MDEMEGNPNLELNYIQCLYLNKQRKKAKKKLEALKANNSHDPFYESLTMELLMEGYHEIKKR